jgi:hypothetical protein
MLFQNHVLYFKLDIYALLYAFNQVGNNCSYMSTIFEDVSCFAINFYCVDFVISLLLKITEQKINQLKSGIVKLGAD